MSAQFGIDYAWGRPDPRRLRRAGVTFVGRYLSHDVTKNLSAPEHRELARENIDVVLAWEDQAERARAGELAGRSDAQNALAQLREIGLPPSTPVHLAVDFDAEGPEVEGYFRGAHEILESATGGYGSKRVLAHLFDAGLIHHGWQTYAWSGGEWEPRALTRQYSNGHQLAGVSCDYDARLAPAPELASDYVPAEEARWIHEYDQVLHERTPWAAMRRRVLRRYMTRRRKLLRRLAEQTGWKIRNRANRYNQLLARTD